MKWKKTLPSSHRRNLIKQYPELPTDVARGEKKRDKSRVINHLPNSAGNGTPDYLEVLGSFQPGKTSSFYLGFQPGFELTALHRRSKALSRPCSHRLCLALQLAVYSAHFSSAGLGTSLAVWHFGACREQGRDLLTQDQ